MLDQLSGLPLTLGVGAFTLIMVVLGLLTALAFVAPAFPFVRRNQALMAPVFIFITLAVTALLLGGALMIWHAVNKG